MDIVHIGFHKTATTWFQDEYYLYVKDSYAVKRDGIQEILIFPSSFEFDPQAARVQINRLKSKKKHLIFCEEELSGNIHTSGLHGSFTKDIAYRIKDVFDNPTVVIFLRSQTSMIASCYSQYVKMGGTRSIDKYLHHGRKDLNRFAEFEFSHFDYYEKIVFYQSLFGSENVKIFLYEDFVKFPKEFLSDYESTLKIEASLPSSNNSKVNGSYKKITHILARFFNVFTAQDVMNKYCLVDIPKWFGFSRLVLRVINKMIWFGRPYHKSQILGKKNIDFIESYYKTSNQKLSILLRRDLDDYAVKH